LQPQPQPVPVLGIDEIRRGRSKWVLDGTGAWQSTVDRWHVGFCDLSAGQGLLGQVEGRNAQVVIDWLAARDQAWRDAVRYVAIDMCTIFTSAIRQALPDATVVVDHFHLVQLANQTLTEVRRRVTMQHRGRRGRKGNREWELRNRLTRAAARMRGEHVDALLDELSTLPEAIAAPITSAWHAKEDLRDLLALARTHSNREDIPDLLHRFYQRCANAGLPELERLAATVETWWPEILTFLHTGTTNAGSEGTNRVIKTITRDAYGFRNPTKPTTTNPNHDHPQNPRTPQPPLTSKSRHIPKPVGTNAECIAGVKDGRYVALGSRPADPCWPHGSADKQGRAPAGECSLAWGVLRRAG
jgi:HPt (histidine-containing phosphotransfer) domain-containing protein